MTSVQCGLCRYCSGCTGECKEFQKILQPKPGVAIYRHVPYVSKGRHRSEVSLVKDDPDIMMDSRKAVSSHNVKSRENQWPEDQTDGIIIHNSINTEITPADFLPEFDKMEISCPRCRNIIAVARHLLQKIDVVNKNEFKGVCDICKAKQYRNLGPVPCVVCERMGKKLAISLMRDSIKKRMMQTTEMGQVKRRRTYSDVDIEKMIKIRDIYYKNIDLLRKPSSERVSHHKKTYFSSKEAEATELEDNEEDKLYEQGARVIRGLSKEILLSQEPVQQKISEKPSFAHMLYQDEYQKQKTIIESDNIFSFQREVQVDEDIDRGSIQYDYEKKVEKEVKIQTSDQIIKENLRQLSYAESSTRAPIPILQTQSLPDYQKRVRPASRSPGRPKGILTKKREEEENHAALKKRVVQKAHSDDLVTTLSGIKPEMFKKNLKYFFPRPSKKPKTLPKSSAHLIKETRDKLKEKAQEKQKKEEQELHKQKEREKKKEKRLSREKKGDEVTDRKTKDSGKKAQKVEPVKKEKKIEKREDSAEKKKQKTDIKEKPKDNETGRSSRKDETAKKEEKKEKRKDSTEKKKEKADIKEKPIKKETDGKIKRPAQKAETVKKEEKREKKEDISEKKKPKTDIDKEKGDRIEHSGQKDEKVKKEEKQEKPTVEKIKISKENLDIEPDIELGDKKKEFQVASFITPISKLVEEETAQKDDTVEKKEIEEKKEDSTEKEHQKTDEEIGEKIEHTAQKDETVKKEEKVELKAQIDEPVKKEEQVEVKAPKDETIKKEEKVETKAQKDEIVKKEEKVELKAQKDETVKKEEQVEVKAPKDKTVKKEEKVEPKAQKEETVKKEEDKVELKAQKDKTVKKEEKVEPKVQKDKTVKKEEKVEPKAQKDETVKKEEKVEPKAQKDETVKKEEKVEPKAQKDETVKKEEDKVELKAQKDKTVKKDEKVEPKAQKDETVKKEQKVEPEAQKGKTVKKEEKAELKAQKDKTVKKDEKVELKAQKDKTVKKEEKVEPKEQKDETVKKEQKVEPEAQKEKTVKKEEQVEVKAQKDKTVKKEEKVEPKAQKDETVKKEQKVEPAAQKEKTVKKEEKAELKAQKDKTVKKEEKVEPEAQKDKTAKKEEKAELKEQKDETVKKDEKVELKAQKDETAKKEKKKGDLTEGKKQKTDSKPIPKFTESEAQTDDSKEIKKEDLEVKTSLKDKPSLKLKPPILPKMGKKPSEKEPEDKKTKISESPEAKEEVQLLNKIVKTHHLKKKSRHKLIKKEKDTKSVEQKKAEIKRSQEFALKVKSMTMTSKAIQMLPNDDDLILRLIKAHMEEKGQMERTPVADNLLPSLHTPLTVRGNRTKTEYFSPEYSSEASDLTLDKDLLLANLRKKQLENEGEIIIGKKIVLKKGVPARPRVEQKPMSPFQKVEFDESRPDVVEPLQEPLEEVELDKPQLPMAAFSYQLSNRTFIDKGWTQLPSLKVLRKMKLYRMHPARPEFDWFEHNKKKGFIQYDTGEKLAEINSDGRGHWYYKNGRLALDYYDSEDLNAQQRIVVYSNGELDDRGRSRPVTILAMFDYSGNGVVFDHKGKIRLKYNQSEGVVLDREIGPVSHWKWHDLNEPPELNHVIVDNKLNFKEKRDLEMIINKKDQAPPRLDDEAMLAIEYDNHMKSQSQSVPGKFSPFQIRTKALKINDQFSLRMIDQKTIYLLYREGATTMKLNLGMVLDNTEIMDTTDSELGDVAVNIDKLPETASMEKIQASLLHTMEMNRARNLREQHIRQPLPVSSVDQLTTAISRPPQPVPIPLPTDTLTAPQTCKYRIPCCGKSYTRNDLF